MKARQEPATIWRVPDDLWEELAPLLDIDKVRKKSGRPRFSSRSIFDGLIWLARTGSQWSALPKEFGAKSTAFDRFTEWCEQGAFERAWSCLLKRYDKELGIDWQWQSADGCIIKSPLGKRGRLARCKPRAVAQSTAAKLAAKGTF